MAKQTPPLGIVELLPSRAGFLRLESNQYLPGGDDIFIDKRLVQQYDLRPGDEIHGTTRASAKSPLLAKVDRINGQSPKEAARRPRFKNLTVIHPEEQLCLECGLQRLGKPDQTNRIIDLLCPLGKGQRSLIVSPPKVGKTMVLQAVAEGIAKNYPGCKLFILLVDERPEEVEDMRRCGYGEVVASSFDFPAKRHIAMAAMTLKRAHRQVEIGRDVVIILDSITRLARAYNAQEQSRGSKTLSGGLGSGALEKPKRFFGGARKIEGGGSLTIIATALIDTGSRMDQVIFEEFKGTGNSELVLTRDLANRRIFPAIDINASGTRREEALLSPDAYTVSLRLRKVLGGMSAPDAMERLREEMGDYPDNKALIEAIGKRK